MRLPSDDCICCRAMRRQCANCAYIEAHPEEAEKRAEIDRRVALIFDRSKGCPECEGTGQLRKDTARPVACWACNAPPPYPGLVPGGLADRALKAVLQRGPRGEGRRGAWKATAIKAADDAARAFWRAYGAATAAERAAGLPAGAHGAASPWAPPAPRVEAAGSGQGESPSRVAELPPDQLSLRLDAQRASAASKRFWRRFAVAGRDVQDRAAQAWASGRGRDRTSAELADAMEGLLRRFFPEGVNDPEEPDLFDD